MSLYGALFSGVSALNAQSQAMGMISDNIANVSTIGYKRSEAAFASMVTAQGRSTAYSPGGVRASTLQRIDQQGIIQSSKSSTDIAISGNGFFVVKNSITDGLQSSYYTRAGQFSENAQGYLTSPSGQYLMGWPVDQNGNIASGSGDLSSLRPVDVAFLGGITRPTTAAEVALTLNAKETPYVYPLSNPVSQNPHFNRALRVYDALGEAQDISMRFFHTTSPTATAAGTVKLSETGNLMDTFPNIASTATYNSSVAVPAPGDLASVAPGVTNGDTFILHMNGESRTIAVDPSWTMADFANAINMQFSGTPASVVGDQLQLNANTSIRIAQGGSQPMTEANINALGLGFVTQARDPVTFEITAGANPAQTVSITDADTAASLVAKINNLPGLNAQFDADGRLVIATNESNIPLTIGGVGGAGQLSVAGLADLGLVASTYSAPTAPSMLTPLDTTANPQNWWYVEFTSPDGTVLGGGMMNFNGDGSVNSSTKPTTVGLNGINWGNGSSTQDISIDITNIGQYSSNYDVIYTEQNGAELGLRTGVTIDAEGFVIAQFSNGENTKLYKLPLATFANPNGLIPKTGNIYQSGTESGEYNLREAGQGSAGLIESSSLEASNVDLADEFSKMIVTQRAYSAGTKVITTSDQMLEELIRLR